MKVSGKPTISKWMCGVKKRGSSDATPVRFTTDRALCLIMQSHIGPTRIHERKKREKRNERQKKSFKSTAEVRSERYPTIPGPGMAKKRGVGSTER